MPDFTSPYQSGLTLYGLALLQDGRAWDGTAFVPTDGDRPACAIAMADLRGDEYGGDLPASLPGGTYLVQSYLQIGGAAADGDPLVGTASVAWPGVVPTEVDFSVDYASGFTLYSLTFNGGTLAWNGSAFADPTGNRPAFADAMTDLGTGTYTGAVPTSLPAGTYPVLAYLRLGAAPADGDPVVGEASVTWQGSGAAAPATAGAFEKALVAALKLNGVVAAIAGGRVYPRKRPQAAPGGTGPTLPALVYEVGLKGHERNLDGPNGIARTRVVIHCQALLDSDVKALAEQLRFAFDGFSGVLGTVPIVEAWLDDDPDDYTPPDDGSDAGVFSVPAAFLFRYRETIPAR